MRFSLITGALALLAGVQSLAIEERANPWQARHGLTSPQLQSVFNDLTSQGYRLNYISGYTINDVPTFAAIFEKKSSPSWVAYHGMTATDYQNKFNTYVSQGYRLVLVNAYTVLGVDYYTAIWDKSASDSWVARHRMTGAEYQSEFNTYTSQGYKLVHVSGYAIVNNAYYAALWVKINNAPAWVAHHGMTSADYQSKFDSYGSQGFRLTLVSGYQVNNVVYYAAIWEKSAGPAYYARHGLTSGQYQSEFDRIVAQGFQLKVVSGYDQGQSDRYAAIWEQIH
ncbi:hypothetical protein BJ875DRAFT_365890 [Amylocarpus encephaloides]|uniref:Uncharacterized protein n=1 Tax=Amylocarpus encephaloides TaxID=45428 RepID=A0A9P8C9Y4_9HELO|nr:hypothetical protein BJ875DRAFT_365890 [Amylocarpus encephaloides]